MTAVTPAPDEFLIAGVSNAGDMAMLSAARHALVLHHDDAEREYACDDATVLEAASQNHWNVVSMRNDFTRVWAADHAADVQ